MNTVQSVYTGSDTGSPSLKLIFWMPHRSRLVEIFQNFRKMNNVTILITRTAHVSLHSKSCPHCLNTLSAQPCKSRALSRFKARQTDRIITYSRAYRRLRVHGSNPYATCHAFQHVFLSKGSGFVTFLVISHKIVPILSTTTLSQSERVIFRRTTNNLLNDRNEISR